MLAKKIGKEDKKLVEPMAALLGFLALLHRVSVSPGAVEFCTPGHKAGRGFATMLAAGREKTPAARPQEVG